MIALAKICVKNIENSCKCSMCRIGLRCELFMSEYFLAKILSMYFSDQFSLLNILFDI